MNKIVEKVVFEMDLDSSDFDKDIANAEKKLSTFGSQATSLGKKFAPASAAASGFLGVAAKGYMEGETAIRRYETVFKDSVGTMDDYYKKHKDTIALTNNEFKAQAASIGDLLNPMGFASEQTADLTQQVIDLASAQSSWAGLDFEDTIYRINAAMLGETEGLKALGVKISAADISTQAATMTGKEYTGMTEEQIKALAVLELATQKSGDAIAAWDEQTENGLGTQERFNQAMRDMRQFMENFGEAIAPGITVVVEALGAMFAALSSLPEPVLAVLGVFLGIIAIAAPLLLVIGGVASGISALAGIIPLLTAAFVFLTGPVGITIALVVGLGTAIGLFLLKYGEPLLEWVKSLPEWFASMVESIKAKAAEMWASFKEGIAGLAEFVKGVFTSIGSFIVAGFQNFVAGLKAIGSFIMSGISAIGSFIGAAFSAFISGLQAIGSFVFSIFSSIGNFIVSVFTSIGSFIGGLFGRFISGITSIPGFFSDAFGTVYNIVTGIFDGLMSKIGSFFDFLGRGLSAAKNAISSIDLNPFDGQSSNLVSIGGNTSGDTNNVKTITNNIDLRLNKASRFQTYAELRGLN